MKGILCGLRDKININIFTLARNIDNKKLKVIYTFHLIMILHSRLQLTEKNINFNSSSDRTVIRSLSSSSSNLKQQTSSHAASNLINSWQTYGPTELTLYRAKAVILLHRIKLVHCLLMGGTFGTQRGNGWGHRPPRPLLTVPNVTAHPSRASVPITILLYNCLLLRGLTCPLKGKIITADYIEIILNRVFNQMKLALLLYLIIITVA